MIKTYGRNSEGNISIWDTNTVRELWSLSVHVNTFPDITFSPDNKYVFFNGYNIMRRLDAKNGNELKSFTGNIDYSIAYSANGKYIASVNQFLNIYDLETERCLVNQKLPFWADAVAYSNDGKYIVFGDNLAIGIFDVANNRIIRTFRIQIDGKYSILISPDGKRILLSSEYKYCDKIINLDNGRELFSSINGRKVFSADGKLVLIHYNSTVSIGDIEKEKILWSFSAEYDFSSVSFSPRREYIFAGNINGAIHVINTSSGKEIAQFISFSGADSQLASASRGLTVEAETATSSIDGEWLSITPDGYYQASPRGDRFLNVRVNNTVIGIDSYRSIFYNPDGVQARLQGRPDPASKANVTIQQAANFMPPTVTIKSPATYTTTNTATTNLSVTVTDQNQPLKNIKIFVNGRAIGKNELAAIKGSNLQAERTSLTVTGNQKTIDLFDNLTKT